jgi:hypothetical protein
MAEFSARACSAPGENHSATRPAQRLVRGRRDHVGDADRARVQAGRYQAGVVRDVGEKDCIDLVGNSAQASPSRF